MEFKIINAVSSSRVPSWGNQKKYIAVHYLGVDGQNHDLDSDGCGAHYYIYWDGTIYQRCSHDAIVWQVGTAGMYTQKHPIARNANTIGIEMCCHCDGNKLSAEDPKWYFTEETQQACVWLVQKLMKDLSIPIENVLRHFDIVNKTCPAPYVHNNRYKNTWTWDEFKMRVGGGSMQLYRVRLRWDLPETQIGAYYVLQNAKNNTPAGYSVYDESGKAVWTHEVTGRQATMMNGLPDAEKIAFMAPLYQKVAKETGLLASVGLAQFCLESGYGTTDLAQNANNMHGMKCSLSGNTWPGSTWDGVSKYNKRTQEQDKNGNPYYVYADFRKYPCMEDSVADRAAYYLGAMNGSSRRYPGIENLKTAEAQIRAIKAGGYATDINYVSKLTNIVNRFNLTQYDVPVDPKPQPTPEPTPTPEPSKTVYRVQVGAYQQKENANNRATYVTDVTQYDSIDNYGKKNHRIRAGYPCFIEQDSVGVYRVYCGSFTVRANADNRSQELGGDRYRINNFVREVTV